MKKLLSIIALLTVCTSLTACSSAVENSIGETESKVSEKRSLEGLRIVRPIEDAVSLINTFEDLEEWSELIVIGEFIDNSGPCYTRSGKIVTDIVSSCPMKITRVLSGDAQVGDVINVLQKESISDDRIITRTELTPMQMGDEWLFCLKHSSEKYGDGWWCVGGSRGRYPTKNSGSNEAVCFSAYSELGVYDREDFHEEFYNKLIEKYGEF